MRGYLRWRWLCLLGFVFACGGGGSSGGSLGSASQLTGTVFAPSGSSAIAGATVYIPSGSSSLSTPTALAKGVTDTADDGTTCDDPPETACASTCSQADGTFSLSVSGCSSSLTTGKIVKGTFTDTFTLDCSESTCAIAVSDTKLSATSTKMAVVTGQFDRMEDVLAKLGFGTVDADGHLTVGTESFTIYRGGGALDSQLTDTSKYPASTTLFSSIDEMKKYSIIFINCGTDESLVSGSVNVAQSVSKAHVHQHTVGSKGVAKSIPASAIANVKTFVQDGGRLYVTDWAYDFIEQAFPSFMDFEGDGSDASTAETQNEAQLGTDSIKSDATIKNDTMKTWLSKQTSNTIDSETSPNSGSCTTTVGGKTHATNDDGTIRIGDFLSGWIVMSGAHTDQSPTIWVEGPVSFTGSSGTVTRPLTVTQKFSSGKVLYSSYHTAKSCPTTGAWPQERILQYLVFEVSD